MKKSKLAVQYVKIDGITVNEKNSKSHSEKQVGQIAKSIRKYGFNNPILCDDNGTIIAGEGRYLASKKLGLKEVPVIRLGHLSDMEKRAYVIADNRLAERGEWSFDALKAELKELREAEDFDVESLGFDDREVEALFAEDESVNFVNEFLESLRNDRAPVDKDEEGNIVPTVTKFGSGDGDRYFSLPYVFTEEERTTVLKAVKKAQDDQGFEMSSQGLVHICQGFLDNQN